MASTLDDNIPQWKKDLILRKRAQTKCLPADQVQLPFNAGTETASSSAFVGGRETNSQSQSGVASSTFSVAAVSTSSKHVPEKCDIEQLQQVNSKVNNIKNKKMVQENVLVLHSNARNTKMVQESVTNGDCCNKTGEDSDSSEELQYGPGIVSKLKSKYLSLTLRESNVKSRPSILTMRRATSLENLLDVDSADELSEPNLNLHQKNASSAPAHTRRYIPRSDRERNGNLRNTQTRYRNTNRGNESIKRARSVETLLRPGSSRESLNEDVIIIEKEGNDNMGRKLVDNKIIPHQNDVKPLNSCNGGARLNRPKRIAPIMDETERPPADHVKQTLMLFEGPPVRRTKCPKPTGEVAAKVANFKHIIDQEKQNNNLNINNTTANKKTPGVKPHITPKPVLTDKTRKTFHARPASPKKSVATTEKPIKPEAEPKLDKPVDGIDKPAPIPDISRVGEVLDCISPDSDNNYSRLNNTLTETPDLIIHSSPMPFRLHSPNSIKSVTASFIKTEAKNSELEPVNSITSQAHTPEKVKINNITSEKATKTEKVINSEETTGVINNKDKPNNLSRENSPSNTSDKSSGQQTVGRQIPSPLTIKTTNTTKTETENHLNDAIIVPAKTSIVSSGSKTVESRSPSPRITSPGLLRTVSPSPENEDNESVSLKEITKQAIENISKAGNTITFNFSDNASKSHLPRLNTVPVRINRLVPDVPVNKPIQQQKPVLEINGTGPDTTKPIMSPPFLNKQPNYGVGKPAQKESPKSVGEAPSLLRNIPRPATPVQNKNLTSREVEKNIINKVKTLEQPVSKVVVSMKSVEDVVVNKNLTSILNRSSAKQSRNQEQTTILFNFQNRDTIPDYIATDGTANVRRGKREKPKPGESGIILLPGAPAEEFCTDEEEDWMLSLNGPPSPCDVTFENDNILIDGKSSISKHPKPQKMRIQFDDQATKLFTYPSEASLLDEHPSPQTTSASPLVLSPPPLSNSGSPGHAVPSLTGSSLASYTPIKMSMTADFQLGVTRSTPQSPIVTPPTGLAESEPTVQEPEQPITYSAETNTDILF